MLPSFDFRSFRSAMLAVALILGLTLAALAQPPAAPPLTTDTTYPNLFYGATPQSIPNSPVVVFVHGLGGSYVDWIEASNCPSPLPVGGCKSSPSSPGLGSNNDMYDYAYQAGFRTVFLSMSANNSTNSLPIQTNAAMLQTLFPTILSHYGVSKVFFVAHSKGGLDLEDALANPKWIGIASAVLELGTPNQGDALADWIFLPANQALGQQLGLLTPGVQALEIANVLRLRTQWDPIFQNAKIPFYTLSGNTYACPKGSSGCPTSFTGPTLTKITTPAGGKATPCGQPGNAPCNDGLVTYPESLLPATYAMQLGVIANNHYQLRMGDESFPYINARVMELSNEQPGVTRVGTGGFGDQHNTWAWSMAWFNNMLYVGTGRETYCVTSATTAIYLATPSLYPPAVGDCTADYHDLPLQAEIWRYNPATNVWTNVFQSPNSLSTVDLKGSTVATARDIGFRGITLVTEPGCNGPCAMYAGGVTSGEIFECHPPNVTSGCTPQGQWPPPRILRSTDGVHWNPIPQNGTLTTVSGSSVWTPAQTCGSAGNQTCFLGSLTTNGTYTTPAYPNYSLRSAAQLCSAPGPSFTCAQDGVLFFQVGDFPGVGRAFVSLQGVNPALGDNCPAAQQPCYAWASPVTATLPMWILENFNNSMYAGTGSPAITGTAEKYGVWSTNGSGTPPYTWNSIITDGAYAINLISDFAMSMQIYSDPLYCPPVSAGGPGGCLYVGTDRPNEMVRIHPDTTGQVQVDATDSWDLLIGNPRTIPSGYPGAGQYIPPMSGIGQYFDNGYTGHFWRMGVGSQGLYMGTWDWSADNIPQPAFGPVWSQEYGTDDWRTPDGVNWTFISKIGLGDGNNTGSRSFASTPYGLFMGTARSVGGTQVFNMDNGKPPNPIIAPPVAQSAFGPLGGTVNISWSPVSGAVDYLVYRITCSSSENTPPPAAPEKVATACSEPGAPSVCSMSPQAQVPQTSGIFGYPSAPEFLGRVTAAAYTEPAANSLQSLYFVIAEDGQGDLSSPSNVVGGPSFWCATTQQCEGQ